MDIYAPLANRLGLHRIKTELEDLSFKYLKPDVFSQIKAGVDRHHTLDESYIDNVITRIRELLSPNHIRARIFGRRKHLWSVFNKMRVQGLTLDQVHEEVSLGRIHRAAKGGELVSDERPAPQHGIPAGGQEGLVLQGGKPGGLGQQVDAKGQPHPQQVVGQPFGHHAKTQPQPGQTVQLGKGAQHHEPVALREPGHGVAGHNEQLDPPGQEKGRDLGGIPGHGLGRLDAVGHPGRVAEINDVLPGQPVHGS